MTRARRLLFWCPLLALCSFGCAHTEQTGSGKEKDSANQPQTASPSMRSAQQVTPKTETGHPPLAASPDELMRPNSDEKISKALVAKGFLSTSEPTPIEFLNAVKAFQRNQGLAATGFADHETLMRLGINPKTVDKTLGTPDVKAAKTNGTTPQQ
jgi:hypothetical protein